MKRHRRGTWPDGGVLQAPFSQMSQDCGRCRSESWWGTVDTLRRGAGESSRRGHLQSCGQSEVKPTPAGECARTGAHDEKPLPGLGGQGDRDP